MARVGDKPKVVNQIYLGSVERIMDMALGQQRTDLSKIQVQVFGSLFLAHYAEKIIDLVQIVDSVIPSKPKEKGPTLGEYFLYAAYNRMIEPRSKLGLPKWYKNLAVHQVRPVDVAALTYQRYWAKWERVDADSIKEISRIFFSKINEIEPIHSRCFLFDTTNYFHYMDSKTPSHLFARGKSKEGKHWLRLIGLALRVSRDSQLPIFYREYEGNCHDSKLFNRLLEEIFASLDALGQENPKLTVVVDKGMNSEANMQSIDQRSNVDFITTYSPAFAEDLIRKDMDFFTPVDTPKNKELAAKNQEEDQMVAFRTTGVYWGRERTVVVTYNPRTAVKQRRNFEKKLQRLKDSLFEIRSKVRAGRKSWSTKHQVRQHYKELCDSLYLPKNLYDLDFRTEGQRLQLYFRRNHYRLNRAGVDCTPDSAIQSMRNLASCMCWHSGKRKPTRMLEEPDPEQAAILAGLGYQVKNGVLHELCQ